ncbi:hypothetical protein [Nocardia miyunensis]|uniref:hypothetical protein n=1 Tax=Nocardia miyunensis TaxID=282684 RepID=UPI0012F4BF49|nr:hypothetical protein [Nocardia miyunensis]
MRTTATIAIEIVKRQWWQIFHGVDAGRCDIHELAPTTHKIIEQAENIHIQRG